MTNHHGILIHKYENNLINRNKMSYMDPTKWPYNKYVVSKEKGQGKYKQNLPHLFL